MNPIHNNDSNNDCTSSKPIVDQNKGKTRETRNVSKEKFRRRPKDKKEDDYVVLNNNNNNNTSVRRNVGNVKQRSNDKSVMRKVKKTGYKGEQSELRKVNYDTDPIKKKNYSNEQFKRANNENDPTSCLSNLKGCDNPESHKWDDPASGRNNRTPTEYMSPSTEQVPQRRPSIDRITRYDDRAHQQPRVCKEDRESKDKEKERPREKRRERTEKRKKRTNNECSKEFNNTKGSTEKRPQRTVRVPEPVPLNEEEPDDIQKEALDEEEDKEKRLSNEPINEGEKKRKRLFKPMNEERGPDKRVRQLPNVRYEVISVLLEIDWDMHIYGSFLSLDNKQRIIFIHEEAEFARENLILGDIIGGVNGQPITSTMDPHSIIATFSCEKKVELRVFRRFGAVPVPKNRAKEIKLVKSDGFAYMMIKVKPDKQNCRNMGSFSTFKVKNRVYVHDIENRTTAAKHFAVGDALLDLNGTPIPYYSLFFGEEFHKIYSETGTITVVVERPIIEDTIVAVQQIYDALTPNASTTLKMAADAMKIGNLASMHHKFISQNSPQPCSILRNYPRRQAQGRRAARTESITITNRTQEFEVGTEVPEEKEAELRRVPYRYSNQTDRSAGREDKSRKKKNNRFLTSIMDFF